MTIRIIRLTGAHEGDRTTLRFVSIVDLGHHKLLTSFRRHKESASIYSSTVARAMLDCRLMRRTWLWLIGGISWACCWTAIPPAAQPRRNKANKGTKWSCDFDDDSRERCEIFGIKGDKYSLRIPRQLWKMVILAQFKISEWWSL